MQKLVDTHVHAWNLDRAEYPWLANDTSILNRSWNLDELEEERIKAGVTEGVLVQAAGNDEDTGLMFEIADSTPWISGVVAWLPLLEPEPFAGKLEAYQRNKYFKGVRHQVHDEKDPRWLLQEPVLKSLAKLAEENIPYDVVGIKDEHIETVLEITGRQPGLRMVFDHLNQPPIAAGEKFGKWGMLMREAAANPNLYAKISGLGTASGKPGEWTAEDVKPYIGFVLEHFGIERCFCGGDWPVSMLAGTYSATWKIYKQAISELVNEKEQEKIFYSNAKSFYRL